MFPNRGRQFVAVQHRSARSPTATSLVRPLLGRRQDQLIGWETEMIETTSAPGLAQTDRALHVRIRAEYLEMPGMRLTVPQAARLFNLDLTHCARVLDALVMDGALWTNGREFLGSNAGRRFA